MEYSDDDKGVFFDLSPITQRRFDGKNVSRNSFGSLQNKIVESKSNIYFGNLRRKFPYIFRGFFFGIPSSKQIVSISLFSFQLKTPKQNYLKVPK